MSLDIGIMGKHEAEQVLHRMLDVYGAVLGSWSNASRSGLLKAWAGEIERNQGHESMLTDWLRDISEALYPESERETQ